MCRNKKKRTVNKEVTDYTVLGYNRSKIKNMKCAEDKTYRGWNRNVT